MYRDIGTSIALNSSTSDFQEIYLARSDVSWNTNATGIDSGFTNNGTDREGNTKNLILNITFDKGTLRDFRKNQLDAATNYNTAVDQMPPVIVSAVKQINTDGPDTFFDLLIRYSEPVQNSLSNTSFQVSDNLQILSGIGGALSSGGLIAGYGTVSIGDIFNEFTNANLIKRNSTSTLFTVRLGGNTAIGGAIRGFTQYSGIFTSNSNIIDIPGNSIDTNITTPVTGLDWALTPPAFSEIRTNERTDRINGWVDNLLIDFDRPVQVYDNHTGFANNSVVWGSQYTVSSVNHSINTVTNNFSLNLEEATGAFPIGDTDSTPIITYSETGSFKFIANYGRIEMLDGTNILALDRCNPVITLVQTDIDDHDPAFDPSPYYNEKTGTYITDTTYNFNPFHPYSEPFLPTDTSNPRTYHNVLRIIFSENLKIENNGIPLNDRTASYNFAGARSTDSLGDTTISGANLEVKGVGRILGCDLDVESGHNFLQFQDKRTLNLHIVGWHDGEAFTGAINSASTIPSGSTGRFATAVSHLNNTVVEDTVLELPIIPKSFSGSDELDIGVVKEWDIYPPKFRIHPKDPLDPYDPTSSINNGLSVIRPELNRLEFVLSEAIWDPRIVDMSGIFNLRFDSTTGEIATGLKYSTLVQRLGDFSNEHDLIPPFIDSDKNDQAFAIEFEESPGKNQNTRISWVFNNSPSNFITDLRGNRLGNVTTPKLSIENAPPFIVETRASVGSDLVYVEFNEVIYTLNGVNAPLLPENFVCSNPSLTIAEVSSYKNSNDKKRFILKLNRTLTSDDLVTDSVTIDSSNTVIDNMANEFPSNKVYPISFYGINIFTENYIEDFVHNGNKWKISDLSGKSSVVPESMKFFSTVDVSSLSTFTPFIYYDILEFGQASFWHPDNNKDVKAVRGIPLGNNRWQFFISGENLSKKTDDFLSIVPRIGHTYCYASKYPVDHPNFDPYDIQTYMVKLQNITEQTGGVTILNNVINPHKGEITKLIYEIQKHGPVSIVVYDLSGNVVKPLVLDSRAAGKHVITWDGKNENGKTVVRGVYFIRVRAPGIMNQIRKVLVVK